MSRIGKCPQCGTALLFKDEDVPPLPLDRDGDPYIGCCCSYFGYMQSILTDEEIEEDEFETQTSTHEGD